MWEDCSNINLNRMLEYDRKCNSILTVMGQKPHFPLPAVWLGSLESDLNFRYGLRKGQIACLLVQLRTNSFWELILWGRNNKCQSHWHQTIGSFNYIYLIFIPHCNSTQPFRGTAESMKPDVVFNLLTSLWKTDSSHCGNVLKTNCSHSSSTPRITKCQGIILCFAWIIFGYKWYLAIMPLLKLYL